MQRIGIVMLTAIGDAVHVLPVVNALKRHDPALHVTWLLQPGPAMLVRGHPAVDEIVLFHRRRGWRAFADIRRELSTRPFDVVLALQDYLKAGLITRLASAPRKLGYDRARARDSNWLFTTHQIPPRPLQHVQDEFLEFVRALGIDPEPVEWALGPWQHERLWQQEFRSQFDRPLASLVVGSTKPVKDWLPERWAEVASALHEDYGLQPVLVGGRSPDEVRAERTILARAPRTVSALDSGLRRLVSILDASALVISLDTGPLHMAVALDRPVISLLGYSHPLRTGPYRRFHDLMIDVFCDPDDPCPISRQHRKDRMSRISVRDVLERVERWRARYAPADAAGGRGRAPARAHSSSSGAPNV
jgi:heptosyltransferase I